MSTHHNVEFLLSQAKEDEEHFRWLTAVDSYNKALLTITKNCTQSDIHEKIGFCYYRAAFQAEHSEEFILRIDQGLEAYEKARYGYSTLKEEARAPIFRCRAMTHYLMYWRTTDPSKKRTLLDDCLTLRNQALTAFAESGNMLEYGKTYSNLWQASLRRMDLAWKRQTIFRLIEEEKRWGEQAIHALAALEETYEEARALFTFVVTHLYPHMYYVADPMEEETYLQQIVQTLNKAQRNFDTLGDRYYAGLCHLWSGRNVSEQMEHALQALSDGEAVRDHHLIGSALYMTAYSTYWKALSTEDPQQRLDLALKAMTLYDQAEERFVIIHPQIAPLNAGRSIIPLPGGYAEHYLFQAEWDPPNRAAFLEQAITAGLQALDQVKMLDIPYLIEGIYHILSKIYHAKANWETNTTIKQSLLHQALDYRKSATLIMEQLTPIEYWNLGVSYNYLADIHAELSRLEPDRNPRKRQLLDDAVAHKDHSLNLIAKIMPFFESIGNIELYAGLYDFQTSYGALLRRLYNLTHHPDLLHVAIQVYTQAIESARKLNHVSRIAEAHWNIAIAHDSLNHYSAAARSFQQASDYFFQAAEKIPMLREFYHDHATYMSAWMEIAQAKTAHRRREYDVAAQHYDAATTLHKSTTRWHYLSSNYEAWAHLEHAENYSRKNEAENAKHHFNTAIQHFTQAHQCIQKTLPTVDPEQLHDFLAQLLIALTLRHKYCTSRIAIEDARLVYQQGEHAAAAELYALARTQLNTILTTLTHEADRQEITPLIDLCHAWELMSLAEAEANPQLFLEATMYFDQAKKHSLHEQDRLLALGHSAFCRALNAGMRFEATREIDTYAQAKKHLETAQNYYVKANIPHATEYATATDRLFDAYIYMDNANTEFDPRKKTQYYQMAETLLHAAKDAYLKTRHSEKVAQITRLLKEVVEEHRLALSLTKVLHTSILASTASFSTPTPRFETAVGIEHFDRVAVHGHLTGPPEVMIGDTLDLKLDLINVGKNIGVLLQVEGIIPQGFKVIQVPRQYPLIPGGLDLRGWKIEPLKVMSIPFVFQVQVTGKITIAPQIIYVDDIGRFRSCRPNPLSILVHPQLTFEFKAPYAQQIFTYLLDAFIEDYMRRQLPAERAGWRTLMQLVKHSNVPKSRVYGVRRGGSAIHELRFRGLIEERIFTGERGRGGRILRVRILFTNEVVKRYVEQQVMKNREC